jgi:hypothetical protein
MSLKPNKDLLLKVVKFAVAFGLIALMVHQELLDFSVLAQLATPLQYVGGPHSRLGQHHIHDLPLDHIAQGTAL